MREALTPVAGTRVPLLSAIAAASSHVSAICRKILHSRSLRALLAHPKHSSARARYSAASDMRRSLIRSSPAFMPRSRVTSMTKIGDPCPGRDSAAPTPTSHRP